MPRILVGNLAFGPGASRQVPFDGCHLSLTQKIVKQKIHCDLKKFGGVTFYRKLSLRTIGYALAGVANRLPLIARAVWRSVEGPGIPVIPATRRHRICFPLGEGGSRWATLGRSASV